MERRQLEAALKAALSVVGAALELLDCIDGNADLESSLGRGRTKTAYARDDRPWNGPEPPGIAYVYAPGRKAERPIAHLKSFRAVLQVDGYAGYRALAEAGDVCLAFCSNHVRRRYYELAAAGPAPLAGRADGPSSRPWSPAARPPTNDHPGGQLARRSATPSAAGMA